MNTIPVSCSCVVPSQSVVLMWYHPKTCYISSISIASGVLSTLSTKLIYRSFHGFNLYLKLLKFGSSCFSYCCLDLSLKPWLLIIVYFCMCLSLSFIIYIYFLCFHYFYSKIFLAICNK